MYRGFNLEQISITDNNRHLYELGMDLFSDSNKKVMSVLDKFVLDKNILDGTKMESDWFPQINSHIFISHSHEDQDTVIKLAGLLYEKLGIISFIDSCVWGNVNNLLKIIDDKLCSDDGGRTYYYSRRNYSTSHVHMMLSTALLKMIDKTECLFFYNTPKSITSSSIITKTESPWIYSEITMSQLLRENIPDRRKIKDSRIFSNKSLDENFDVEYELSLKHLTPINVDTLKKWIKCGKKKEFALDELYDLKRKNKSNIIYG